MRALTAAQVCCERDVAAFDNASAMSDLEYVEFVRESQCWRSVKEDAAVADVSNAAEGVRNPGRRSRCEDSDCGVLVADGSCCVSVSKKSSLNCELVEGESGVSVVELSVE